MPVKKTDIENFLLLAKTCPVIDVRSPAEYKHAHIPGAMNIPLFDDEERKIVGTLYKQRSREEAIKKGLEFFGPKMRKIVEEAEVICNRQYAISMERKDQEGKNLPIANCLLIYCWRGGMRSAAIAWLLGLYGFTVLTLTGGYKSFRRFALQIFSQPVHLQILGGYTGSGKTELLKALQQRGEHIIDLEDLAKHKGSAFGNIGMPAQPGQEMFENLLAVELHKIITNFRSRIADPESRIWLEDESQRIGLVNIPNDWWATMRRSPVCFLDIPFEERLKNIVHEYGSLDRKGLVDAIGRIKDKLGGQHAKEATNLLEEGNTIESFRILLKYYDKLYAKSLYNRANANSLLHIVHCKGVTVENAIILSEFSLQQPLPV